MRAKEKACSYGEERRKLFRACGLFLPADGGENGKVKCFAFVRLLTWPYLLCFLYPGPSRMKMGVTDRTRYIHIFLVRTTSLPISRLQTWRVGSRMD